MKLIYISPLRYPSEKAGSQFSMKSCEEFSNAGVEVELWAPCRFNKFSNSDPFEFHKVKNNFKIRRFFAIDLTYLGTTGFIILSFSFAVSVFFYVLFLKKKSEYYFYSHESTALYLLTFVANNTIFEMHDFLSNNFLNKSFFRRVNRFVVTNSWKKQEIIKIYSVPETKIIVATNAVDLKEFDIDISKEDARKKLNLPINNKIILYTGHLYSWKGIDTLVKSSKFLYDNEKIYILGGTDLDIKNISKIIETENIKSVYIMGRKPHEEIPLWLKAADILVLPNTAKQKISKYYTSPVKMFEYMASKRPIIASDLPSIREIAEENSIYFFKPDDPKDLAKNINLVINYDYGSYKKALSAYNKVVKIYTWENRTKRIINFLENTDEKNN